MVCMTSISLENLCSVREIRFGLAMAVSLPLGEITDQETRVLGPALRAVFRGWGNFLALGRLSSDRSFDKEYSQNGILLEVAIIYDFD